MADNPQFAALHKLIIASVLNEDGTSKRDPEAEERAAIREVGSKHTNSKTMVCWATLLTTISSVLEKSGKQKQRRPSLPKHFPL